MRAVLDFVLIALWLWLCFAGGLGLLADGDLPFGLAMIGAGTATVLWIAYGRRRQREAGPSSGQPTAEPRGVNVRLIVVALLFSAWAALGLVRGDWGFENWAVVGFLAALLLAWALLTGSPRRRGG